MAANSNDWDDAYIKSSTNPTRSLKFRQQEVMKFQLDRARKILVLGCGDGTDILAFKSLGYNDVYGIDISITLLSKAKGHKLVLTDIQNMGISKESFEVIWVNSVLYHFLSIEDVLREIKRILIPGGEMCFIEARNSVMRTLLDFYCFSPMAKPIRYAIRINALKHRITMLSEEYARYCNWLHCESQLFHTLRAYKFNVISHQKSVFYMYVKCKLEGDKN